MSDGQGAGPQRTPLYDEHVRLGARMTNFGGFEMPVQYAGIVDEHLAVRERAGLFDLSHMGQIRVRGDGAAPFLEWAFTNNISNLKPGQARYSPLCRPDGGIVDDVIIYRREDEFFIVANAANTDKDAQWLDWLRRMGPEEGGSSVDPDTVVIDDDSDEWCVLAIQGPKAEGILQKLTSANLGEIRPFRFIEEKVAGHDALISRTGYTGEDGFELYAAAGAAVALWRELLAAGEGDGLVPVGLGARDTLRLEMRFPLYGNDIDDSTSPLEAGLDFTVKLNKADFVGKNALVKQRDDGLSRRLIGFKMLQRGIPRQGYALYKGDEEVGHVTSGSLSPSLGEPVGMGYVKTEHSAPGTELAVEVRGRRIPVQVVEGRFVQA